MMNKEDVIEENLSLKVFIIEDNMEVIKDGDKRNKGD